MVVLLWVMFVYRREKIFNYFLLPFEARSARISLSMMQSMFVLDAVEVATVTGTTSKEMHDAPRCRLLE